MTQETNHKVEIASEPEWKLKRLETIKKLGLTKDYKHVGKVKIIDYAFLLNIKNKGKTQSTWIRRLKPDETFDSLAQRLDNQKVQLSLEGITSSETLMYIAEPTDNVLQPLTFQGTLSIMDTGDSFIELGSIVDVKACLIKDDFGSLKVRFTI